MPPFATGGSDRGCPVAVAVLGPVPAGLRVVDIGRVELHRIPEGVVRRKCTQAGLQDDP